MQGFPAGVGHRLFQELDSTNAEAVRLARQGQRGPLWIQALRQSAGRGRRGRAWLGGAGNLYATLLMSPDGPPEAAAQRSFVAALALERALVAHTGAAERFSLKWPNDVLLDGRKLAGILLEGGAGGTQGEAPYLCVGIGVNLASAPPPDALEPQAVPPVALGTLGTLGTPPPDPQVFLASLANAFAALEAQFRAEGFAPIRAAWLARAARLGETVTARLPDREITGRFETIDASGAIVLQNGGRRISLPAAEIHFEEGARDASGH